MGRPAGSSGFLTRRRGEPLARTQFGLLVFGVVMLGGGLVYPGSNAAAVTTLIIFGAAIASTGILLPRLDEFEIGPAGLKTKLEARAAPPRLSAQPADLNRFAYLASGDAYEARDLVEKSLALSRDKHRHLTPDERDSDALQRLVGLLENARERAWLAGRLGGLRPSTAAEASAGDDTSDFQGHREIVNHLQQLDFAPRVTFLLRNVMDLRADEIADLLERPQDVIDEELAEARRKLAPYIDQAYGEPHRGAPHDE